MAQIIDFNGLLKDLFQENVPIGENEPEIWKEESATLDTIPLQACNLYEFMRKIVMEHFGMGRDYAFRDREGNPLKSWFTVSEAIEAAKSQGYELTITEARAYLDKLIKPGYIETDNYKYRRCAFWDKDMEKYLLKGAIEI